VLHFGDVLSQPFERLQIASEEMYKISISSWSSHANVAITSFSSSFPVEYRTSSKK
jgi:hypothetical protein